jgi:hypothetical protein
MNLIPVVIHFIALARSPALLIPPPQPFIFNWGRYAGVVAESSDTIADSIVPKVVGSGFLVQLENVPRIAMARTWMANESDYSMMTWNLHWIGSNWSLQIWKSYYKYYNLNEGTMATLVTIASWTELCHFIKDRKGTNIKLKPVRWVGEGKKDRKTKEMLSGALAEVDVNEVMSITRARSPVPEVGHDIPYYS